MLIMSVIDQMHGKKLVQSPNTVHMQVPHAIDVRMHISSRG